MALSQRQIQVLDTVCFIVAGFAFKFPFHLSNCASEDILSGLSLPTAVVIISNGLPSLLVSMLSPFFFDKTSKLNDSFFS